MITERRLSHMRKDAASDSRKWAVPTTEKHPSRLGQSKLDCLEAYCFELIDEVEALWGLLLDVGYDRDSEGNWFKRKKSRRQAA